MGWRGMGLQKRLAWLETAVSEAASNLLGHIPALSEPLMSAGLDSLGASESTFCRPLINQQPAITSLSDMQRYMQALGTALTG